MLPDQSLLKLQTSQAVPRTKSEPGGYGHRGRSVADSKSGSVSASRRHTQKWESVCQRHEEKGKSVRVKVQGGFRFQRKSTRRATAASSD